MDAQLKNLVVATVTDIQDAVRSNQLGTACTKVGVLLGIYAALSVGQNSAANNVYDTSSNVNMDVNSIMFITGDVEQRIAAFA